MIIVALGILRWQHPPPQTHTRLPPPPTTIGQFEEESGEFVLVDLDTTNGTLVTIQHDDQAVVDAAGTTIHAGVTEVSTGAKRHTLLNGR